MRHIYRMAVAFLIAGLLILMSGTCPVQAEEADSSVAALCESEGYRLFMSDTEAVEYALNYAKTTCWEDKDGETFVVRTDSPESFAAENFDEGSGGLWPSYWSMAFDTFTEVQSVASGDENSYYAVTIGKTAYEEHSEGYTKEMYEAADAAAKQVISQFSDGSTYDKIKGVYDYLRTNVAYDYDNESGEPYSALIEEESVCAGYAEAFQIMMEKLGIESYICSGVINSTYHAWNAVKLDGAYYYIDATFARSLGDSDGYFLFGTDKRPDIFSLQIASQSHADSGQSGEGSQQADSAQQGDDAQGDISDADDSSDGEKDGISGYGIGIIVIIAVVVVVIGCVLYRRACHRAASHGESEKNQ